MRTGSPYAVSPGRVRKADGTPYRVYTPFARAWVEHGWRPPAAQRPRRGPLDRHRRRAAAAGSRPTSDELGPLQLPAAGEAAALARWRAFRDSGAVDAYADRRDRPDLAGTSTLSAALRWGEIHPRTLLADLADRADLPVAAARRSAASWPGASSTPTSCTTSRSPPGPACAPARPGMPYDTGPIADERFAAWCDGRTGYPFVDAGMRQLRAEGWVHNRVRMVVASFLVKDLHLDWTRGARWFMRWLRDGDLASNQHGWQWVAGTGTDAAPYHRVFNPVRQGLRYDPDGDYVRRYVARARPACPARSRTSRGRHRADHRPRTPSASSTTSAERVLALQRYAASDGGQRHLTDLADSPRCSSSA